MASLVQSILSARALFVCFESLASDGSASSSGLLGFLMILLLFLVFLLPFDRRIIERYIMRIGAEATGRASLRGGSRSAKLMMDYGFSEKAATAGPYTRQLCDMLDLEVVTFSRRKFFFGSWLVELAIGRWNEDAHDFELVTEWCETWEDLEEQARQAMKSFRGIADPKYRGASNA
jgi:hypothetical protein